MSIAITDRLCIVAPEQAGQRLDRFLTLAFAETGLRGWRRMCEAGRVLVDGRCAGAAYKVREGQSVSVRARMDASQGEQHSADGHDVMPFCVAQTGDLAAVFKPSGWHSAALAGSTSTSLEAWVGASGLLGAVPEGKAPALLNRLDSATSGLVLFARTPAGAALWHAAEDAGQVDKLYIALVHGLPGDSITMHATLDTDNRSRTKVLQHDNPDTLRHTTVHPLFALEDPRAFFPELAAEAVIGLVVCHIRKGARHQIRAHLASAGFPLAGDALYGSPLAGNLYLHHYSVRLPGFSASLPPVWASDFPDGANDLATR